MKYLIVMERGLFVLVKLTLMRSSGYEGMFQWEAVCRFYSGRWLSSPFHLLPSHTHVDEQQCLLSLTNTCTHTLTHSYSLAPLCTHTVQRPTHMHSQHKLFPSHCNMNRHVHTASHLDVTALPGLLCYIKNSTSIIVKATSRWRWICLALTEVMWKLLFFLSVYFGDNTSYSSLCTERMSLIYSMTHLCEGARFFAASHHISSLSQGWYFCVNYPKQLHFGLLWGN